MAEGCRGELLRRRVTEAGKGGVKLTSRQKSVPLTRLEIWVPALPSQLLSPNTTKSRRNPWALSEARLELADVAYHAILAAYAPSIPRLNPPVVIRGTFHARHGTRNGDGLYRAMDPSNNGGEPFKPLVDALVRAEIIPDDTYKQVEEVRLRIRHVESLAEEGVLMEVWECEGA